MRRPLRHEYSSKMDRVARQSDISSLRTISFWTHVWPSCLTSHHHRISRELLTNKQTNKWRKFAGGFI